MPRAACLRCAGKFAQASESDGVGDRKRRGFLLSESIDRLGSPPIKLRFSGGAVPGGRGAARSRRVGVVGWLAWAVGEGSGKGKDPGECRVTKRGLQEAGFG